MDVSLCRLRGICASAAEVKAVLSRLLHRCAECGNPMGSLYPTHVKDWWAIIEDVFSSPPARRPAAQVERSLSYDTTSHPACGGCSNASQFMRDAPVVDVSEMVA